MPTTILVVDDDPRIRTSLRQAPAVDGATVYAVADVDREIAGQVSARGEPLPPRRVRTTHVLRREDGGWRIAVFRVADLRDASEVR